MQFFLLPPLPPPPHRYTHTPRFLEDGYDTES